jgi:hypothetical protein
MREVVLPVNIFPLGMATMAGAWGEGANLDVSLLSRIVEYLTMFFENP